MDLSEEVSLVMNTLSLIYYDLYDLPFINQPEGGRDSLKEQIPADMLPDIFTYVKYLEHYGGFVKSDMRLLYNSLFQHSILKEVKNSECSVTVDESLFSLNKNVGFGSLSQLLEDNIDHRRNSNNNFDDDSNKTGGRNDNYLVEFRVFKRTGALEKSY